MKIERLMDKLYDFDIRTWKSVNYQYSNTVDFLRAIDNGSIRRLKGLGKSSYKKIQQFVELNREDLKECLDIIEKEKRDIYEKNKTEFTEFIEKMFMYDAYVADAVLRSGKYTNHEDIIHDIITGDIKRIRNIGEVSYLKLQKFMDKYNEGDM